MASRPHPDITIDVAAAVDADLPKLSVYENQRRFPVAGWSETKMLPTDRWKWSNKEGTKEMRKDDPSIIPAAYTVVDDKPWYVDIPADNTTDEQGWQYALDFGRTYSAQPWFACCVRRRRWLRCLVPKADLGLTASPGFVLERSPRDPPLPRSTTALPSDITVAEASPMQPPTPACTPKTEEEIELDKWKSVRGPRSGTLHLQLSNVRLAEPHSITVQVSQSTHSFETQVAGEAAHFPMFHFETFLLVADDTEPIKVTVLQKKGTFTSAIPIGEAAFAPRAAEIGEKFISMPQKIYTEVGHLTLPLHPRPEDNGKSETKVYRLSDQIGTVDVHWSFELRDTSAFTTCSVCGKVNIMCTCATSPTDHAADALIATVSCASDPVFSPVCTKKRGRVVLRFIGAEAIRDPAGNNSIDPYCAVTYKDIDGLDARAVTSSSSGFNPTWTETITIDVGDFTNGIQLSVWDRNTFVKDREIGIIDPISIRRIERANQRSGVMRMEIQSADRHDPIPCGHLLITLEWIPFTM